MAPIKEKIGILGLGRMGRCLVQGLVESETVASQNILFTTGHADTREAAARELAITGVSTNEALVKQCDIVVLAVKPQNAAEVLAGVGKHFTKNHTLISIAASLDTKMLEKAVGKAIAAAAT